MGLQKKSVFKYIFLVLILFFTLQSVYSEIFPLTPCGNTVSKVVSKGKNKGIILENNCIYINFPEKFDSKKVVMYDKLNNEYFNLVLESVVEKEKTGIKTKKNDKKMFKGADYVLTKNNVLIYTTSNIEARYQIISNKLKISVSLNNFPKDYTNTDFWLKYSLQKSSKGKLKFVKPVVDGKKGSLEHYQKDTFLYEKVGDGTLLWIDPIYVVDYSPIPVEHLINGTVSTDGDTSFDTTIDITTDVSDNDTGTHHYTNYGQPIYLDTLKYLFTFNEIQDDGYIMDWQTNRNAITYGDPQLNVQGIEETGILLDGAGDGGQVQNSDIPDLAQNESVMMCWSFNSNFSSSSDEAFVDTLQGFGTNGWSHRYLQSGNVLRCRFRRNNVNTEYLTSATNYFGRWVKMCCYNNATNHKTTLYLDGVAIGSSGTGSTGTMSMTRDMGVGIDDGIAGDALTGFLDEVCIWHSDNLEVPQDYVDAYNETQCINESSKGTAITGKWNQTYNTGNWFLRFHKNTTLVGTYNVSAYHSDLNTLSSQGVQDQVLGSGWFNINVTSLVKYQTNNLLMNITMLRVWTENSLQNISEFLLQYEVNDSENPNITNCAINNTLILEGEKVRLECNVTDDVDVERVNGTIEGIGYTFIKQGDTYYKDFTCNTLIAGLNNWTLVEAYDILNNKTTYLPNQSFTCVVFNISLVDAYPLDENYTNVVNFSTDNLEEIEYVDLNFSVNSNSPIDIWYLNYTASGTNGCALGNKQCQVCYNLNNATYNWIQFVNNTNTDTFDGTQGNLGDSIIPTIKGNTTNFNLSFRIDEHYNPNVFKWYDALFNFSDVKFQTDKKVNGSDIFIRVNVFENILPLDADQYKLDFRLEHNEPDNPLEVYICNTSYTTGHPHDFEGCKFVCKKFWYELQDVTKFRCIFTKELINVIGNLKYVFLEHHNLNYSQYYAIKTYGVTATNYSISWEHSTDGASTWQEGDSNYETEMNINWFYDGVSPTDFSFLLWMNNTEGQEKMLYSNYTWVIDPVNNYPPIISIARPVPNTNITLPYQIEFSVADPNDDDLNVSLLLYQNNTLYTPIVQNMSYNFTFNSYYWNQSIPYGNYELVALACETNTTEMYCENDTHLIHIMCISDWNATYNSCLTNNSMLKTYVDLNSCTAPFTPPVPGDNGTYVYCNYCSENLFYYDTACGDDLYINRTWVDTVYGSCCQVTNLTSDCSILYSPYNTVQRIFCGTSDLLGFECQEVPNFNIREKEYCIAYIPTNYSNESFKCYSYVRWNTEILQTNPEYKERTNSLITVWNDEESREYFQDQNGIVNFYFTKKNILPNTDYVLGLKCSSPQRILTSEKNLNIDYEDMEFVFSRTHWLMENGAYIIIGVIVLILILITLVLYWRGVIF